MSYSTWLAARQAEYRTALSAAKTEYDANNTSHAGYQAYAALVAYATITTTILGRLVAGTSTLDDIDKFQVWLYADLANNSGTHVAGLGLTIQTQVDTGARNALGGLGTAGGTFRRWKGQPLYTFGEGLMIGKSNQVIAYFGTRNSSAPEIASGYGTDGLLFFDGKPMSKNTATPGTAVFAGDLMVSGSLRGDGGVIIIDDVIQLETGVASPAGIALNSSGKILLRHRGDGFTQFIDPALTEAAATDAAKLWISDQNTSSTRLANSLIPNSNFESIEYYGSSSPYSSRPAGPIVVGNTDKTMISYQSSGILKIDHASDTIFGILLPAVDISTPSGTLEEKYTFKIRFTSPDGELAAGASQGLFVTAFESDANDTTWANNAYVGYVGSAAIGSTVESGHTDILAGTRDKALTPSSSISITGGGTWQTQSYSYSKTSTARFVSFCVWVGNCPGALLVDYVSLVASPPLEAAVQSLIDTSTAAISSESDTSLIQNSQFSHAPGSSSFQWETFGTVTTSQQAGDDGGNDKAVRCVAPSSLTGTHGDGLTSVPISVNADKYTVGLRLRAVGAGATVKIKAFERQNAAGPFATGVKDYIGPQSTSTSDAADSTVTITTSKINDAGASSSSGTTQALTADTWTTILGDYTVSGYAITDTETAPTSDVTDFSIGVELLTVNSQVELDYVYVAQQASSISLATSMADQAYGDSQVYVSELNSLVAQEQGSLIPNAAMGMQEFVVPSGGTIASQARPAGFRYLGANEPYRISYAPTESGIGKNAVMKIEVAADGSGIVTPPWALDCDKYSIIVRARAVAGSVDLRLNVNYCDTNLPTEYVTIAHEALDDDGNNTPDQSSITFGKGQTSTAGGDIFTHAKAQALSSPKSVGSAALEIDVDNVEAGQAGTNYDWNVGTGWENITVTWNRGGSDTNKLASLTIRSKGSYGHFLIDYILVIPQTVSFDLAESTADTKKQEAIDASSSYAQAISTNMTQEAGSQMPNAAFASYVTVNGVQRPTGYWGTRGTRLVRRLMKTTPNNPATSDPEIVLDIGQTGDALEFSPGHSGVNVVNTVAAGTGYTNGSYSAVTSTSSGSGTGATFDVTISGGALSSLVVTHPGSGYVGSDTIVLNTATIGAGNGDMNLSILKLGENKEDFGILCPAIALGMPIGALGGGDQVNSISPSNNGKYSFLVRLRANTSEALSVKIIAHEYFGTLGNGKTHCLDSDIYSSGTGIETAASSLIQTFTTSGSPTGAQQALKLINVTSNDSDVGASELDDYREIIPVDNSEGDGDTDNLADNYETWYDIGGTYTANSNTRAVCFEILINSDIDTDNTRSYPYVDYIFFAPQTFDANFADSLAAARKAEAISASETYADNISTALQNQINTINSAIEAEDPSASLIPNSTFFETFEDTNNYAKRWLATRSTQNKIRVYDQDNALNTIGTYIKPYDASDDSDNVYGMLSEKIVSPSLAVTTYNETSSTSTIGKYNVALRCRGVAAAVVQSTVTNLTAGTITTSGSGHTSNSSYGYNSDVTDVNREITGTANTHYINESADYLLYTWSAPAYSGTLDAIYIYVGYRLWTSVESDDDQIFNAQDSSGNPVTVNWDVDWYNSSTWTDFTTASSAGSCTMTNTGATFGTADTRLVRIKLTGSNLANVVKLKFSTNVNHDTGDHVMFHVLNVYYEHTIAATNPDFHVRIIAHEIKKSFMTGTKTHVIDSSISVTSPHSSLSASVETFTNNNSASGGKSSELTIIDLENSSASADTNTEVASSHQTWRNIVGSYTPTDDVIAVSFEFLFYEDPDNDNTLASILVDSVYMDIATCSEDVATGISNARGAAAEATAAADATAKANAAQSGAISEAQLTAYMLSAEANHQIVGIVEGINSSVSSEQGSILYNAGFSYMEANSPGVTTTFSGSGLNDATVTVGNATSSDLYKWVIAVEGTPDKADKYRGGVLMNAATHRPNVPTSAVQMNAGGPDISFGASTGHTAGDYWEARYDRHERPVGYRLARIQHIQLGSDTGASKNLRYYTTPDTGNASIIILENDATGDYPGTYNSNDTSISLLTPPISTPNDGNETSYQIAVKIRSRNSSDTIDVDLKVHELYSFLDTSSYVTFIADQTGAATVDIDHDDDTGTGLQTYVGPSTGCNDKYTDTDVYRFTPHSSSLTKAIALKAGSCTIAEHTQQAACTGAGGTWTSANLVPEGRITDVTVTTYSDANDTTTEDESVVQVFKVIGGGFDASVDTKQFVIEIVCTNINNSASHGYIIDYIHVVPSTIGAAAAQTLADARAAIKADAALTSAQSYADGVGTSQQTYTDNQITATETARDNMLTAVTNESDSLLSNSTFTSKTSLRSIYASAPAVDRPTGWTLYRYANISTGGTGHNTSADRKRFLKYNASSTDSNPIIQISENTGITDGDYSLLSPALLANSSAYVVAIKCKPLKVSDSNVKVRIRSHQYYGTDISGFYNVACSNSGQDYTVGSTSYTHNSNSLVPNVYQVSPLTKSYNPSSFDVTIAEIEIDSQSPLPAGTWTESNVIKLNAEADLTYSQAETITADDWTIVAGSVPIHSDCQYVSFEFYFESIDNSSNETSGIVIDSIIVQPWNQPEVDYAVALSESRIYSLAEILEEEEDEEKTNVIFNPSGKLSYEYNSTYTVPKGWKYIGKAGLTIPQWGYRSGSTLVNKPARIKKLSWAKEDERGITSSNHNDKYMGGIVSKPFKISSEDYECEVSLQVSGSGTHSRVFFLILEYDSQLNSNQYISCADAGGDGVGDLSQNVSSYTNHSIPIAGSGTTVTATRQVNMLGNTLNENYIKTVGNSALLDDSKTGKIWFQTIGSTVTEKTTASYWDPTSTDRTLIKFAYEPTTSAKYAAIVILQYDIDFSTTVHYVNVLADQSKSFSRFIGGRGGIDIKSGNQGRFGTFTDDNSSVFGGLTLSVAMVNNPTSPVAPSIANEDISIISGHSAFTSTTENSNNIDPRFAESSHVVNQSGDSYNRPDGLKHTFQNASGDRTYLHGLMYVTPQYYTNQSWADQIDINNNIHTWQRGVSYYSPTASNYISVQDGQKLIMKQASDGAGLLYFYEHDSTDEWSFHLDSNNYMQLKYNASGKFKFRDTGQFQIYADSSNDSTGGLRIFSNGDTDWTKSWTMFSEYFSGSNGYTRLQFYYGGFGNQSAGKKGFMGSTGSDSKINFTGQHRCEDINDSLSNMDTGLIVVSTGKYNNLLENDRPTINESLPIVEISSKRKQKSCFGVLSDKEDDSDQREYINGVWGTYYDKNGDVDRLIINSLGEGAIWVCNIGGDLENGDYITTCEIPGHGMLQDDDLLHNYTVAKITQDCNFELDNPYYDCVEFEFEGQTYRKAFVGCTYHCG